MTDKPTPKDDVLTLMQARHVLRNLDRERPGCGYLKMADACGRAADILGRESK